MLDKVPTLGLSDQVTAVLDVPVTTAVNCWDCAAMSDTADGPNVTPTGIKLIVPLTLV